MTNSISTLPKLIADIGGTNARFAIVADNKELSNDAHSFSSAQTLQCSDFEKVEDAIEIYLKSHGIAELDGICFAVAGPIRDKCVSFTNNHWEINGTSLANQYQTDRVHLLNDFEAIAYSLANLESDNNRDIMPIGHASVLDTASDFTIGVTGPGSGLGVAGLCQRNGQLFPLVGEGGHAGFSPENTLQLEILSYLHKKYDDRVSRERLISGPGLINIHEALCQIHGQENQGLSAADIANSAVDNQNAICIKAFALFFEILGQVSGDIALTLGASEGMFIGGGIALRYPDQLAQSRFRAGFENKGRHTHLMQSIPTWLITHKNPGLLGASVYAKSYL